MCDQTDVEYETNYELLSHPITADKGQNFISTPFFVLNSKRNFLKETFES